jgi:uncharacterized membrane protein YgcG
MRCTFSKKIFFFFFLISLAGFAQQGRISGKVIDAEDNSPIIGAAVVLMQLPDTTKFTVISTDTSGRFFFRTAPGNYRLKVELLSYRTYYKNIKLDSSLRLGRIVLKTEATMLKETVVETRQIRVEQKGDTTQFNGDAYKVNKDATTEDLVNKMPGVTSQNGSITVNGEQVKQILVDGKPFFGDDPNMALKNLPAEVVDKIQVFDKLSDQAQFTGVDDGNSQKTINIVTKSGKNNGQFGKVYGGYGIDAQGPGVSDKYIGGGNMNLFKGDRRFSIIGLSNNINQQNFSTQDLSGMAGSSSSSGRGGGGSGGGGGGNSAANFLVGQQGGITTTQAVGMNYSDNWGKKIKLTASYFFNDAINTNNSSLTRNYIVAKQNGLHYDQNSTNGNGNLNHRANLRFEYNPDTANSIIFTPKISWQHYTSSSSLNGINRLVDTLQSRTSTQNTARSLSYDLAGNILFRHKFKKPRRTVSLNISGDYNPKNAGGSLYSLNTYYTFNDSTLLDQQNTQNTMGLTISPNLSYTEPLGKRGQLMFTYNPSLNNNNTEKLTFNKNASDQTYTNLDTSLSNKFNNTYLYHRGGLSYRLTDKKLNFNAGLNFQYATLTGTEDFPTSFNVNKNFQSVLPQMMFNYRFSKTRNLRIFYRTNTVAPSISQLQNVINNSNPLLLTTGNPDLKQDYEHSLTFRYGSTNTVKASNFMAFLFANYIQNYVTNSTYIPTHPDTVSGVFLKPGSQLTKPVNMNGYWNARSFVTYGVPITKIKCNLNLNTGFTYNRIPDLINNQTNLANNYNFSEGLVLGSNISDKFDFSIAYTGNYSIVKNTLQKQSDNNYFNHTASARVNLMPWKGLVINTTVSQTLYAGLAQNFNQNYTLWTGAIGYKFLKDQSLDIRLSVFDILKQNNSISRNVTETYIEDSHTQVLTQYYMLTVTYNIKKFKGMSAPAETPKSDDEMRRNEWRSRDH